MQQPYPPGLPGMPPNPHGPPQPPPPGGALGPNGLGGPAAAAAYQQQNKRPHAAMGGFPGQPPPGSMQRPMAGQLGPPMPPPPGGMQGPGGLPLPPAAALMAAPFPQAPMPYGGPASMLQQAPSMPQPSDAVAKRQKPTEEMLGKVRLREEGEERAQGGRMRA